MDHCHLPITLHSSTSPHHKPSTKAMDKSKKSQILKLSLIALLLITTPLIPTTLRATYLYFVFNLLIIALGAEAGLLSVFSKSTDDKKPQPTKPVAASESSPPHKEEPPNATGGATAPEKPKVVEKCLSEKIGGSGAMTVHKVKKCPSMPSIFFIGGGEAEAEEVVDNDDEEEEEEVEGEEVGDVNGQELFTKAETFIGNFYKQLKMQREESWKRIHGLYQKAF
ncbi:unnamed protein product [Camellia sinensis]